MCSTNGVSINQSKRSVTVEGKTIKFPSWVQGNNVSIINNQVYVDGYELVDGEWKRTLKALWHRLF